MIEANPICSPTEPASHLTPHGDPMNDPKLYHSIVSALQYVTITSPEISCAVNRVCQFMHSPTNDHWKVVKRILCYLKGTINHGLQLHVSKTNHIAAFSDAGWAGDVYDCNRNMGLLYFMEEI